MKNNDEEYQYMSISWPSCHRRHKTRVLLMCNQGSTLFADEDTAHEIITFNFWPEHGLIIVNPDRPRHYRLDMINQKQLLALNYM